jgi:hypothetical protein
MYREYYTKVSASSGFWERLIMKHISDELSCRIGIEGISEINIISTKGPALDEIIRLSLEYPDVIFHVRIAGDNIYENYVFLYECCGGKTKLIKEGYEYCFGISTYDRDKLPYGLFEKFKKTATEYYLRLESNSQNNVENHLSSEYYETDNNEQNNPENKMDYKDKKAQNHKQEHLDNISVLVRYETPKVCLTARKLGLTFIDVQAEFRDKEKNRLSDTEYNNSSDDSPF